GCRGRRRASRPARCGTGCGVSSALLGKTALRLMVGSPRLSPTCRVELTARGEHTACFAILKCRPGTRTPRSGHVRSLFVRFVWAVVAFVLATLLIGAGIAQRTIFMGPTSQQTQLEVEQPSPYVLVDGAVLRENPGQQTLLIHGDGDLFA